jgi:peroxiredoxin
MNHPTLRIGDCAPSFSLPGVEGKTYTLSMFADAPVLIVVFSCNHCPYVQAYEVRLIALQRDYADRGVRLVAINSNDDTSHAEDSFPNMVSRAQAKGFNFPYLRDGSQQVAMAYGATHTPHLFLFDRNRRLAYTGKIDDNWQRPDAVTQPYLRQAIDALLSGAVPGRNSDARNRLYH